MKNVYEVLVLKINEIIDKSLLEQWKQRLTPNEIQDLVEYEVKKLIGDEELVDKIQRVILDNIYLVGGDKK